jgi:hypothetical protein
MMSLSLLILVLAVLAGLVVIGALAFVFIRANKVNLTETGEDKPDWMRQNPPAETVAATAAEGQGVQVFHQAEGEKLAAPFAEQIEDILRALLQAHPELNHYDVDLGTSPDTGLEIWVNGQKYDQIEDLPDDGLRQVVYEAVQKWEKH